MERGFPQSRYDRDAGSRSSNPDLIGKELLGQIPHHPQRMLYVYLIKGKNNYFYTGCTSNLRKRFHEHNLGVVVSTKLYRPFILIYYEACLNNKDAYNREKYLKSRLGKNYLRKRLKNWYNKA